MINVLILLAVLFYTIYKFFRINSDFWEKLGLPYLNPIPVVGNIAPIVFLKKSIGIFLADIYKTHRNKPYIGIFLGGAPCLIMNDYNVVETIMNKDFPIFSQRIFSPDKHLDPMGARSIFALTGDRWKVARSKLSPAFTTLKLKTLFDEMVLVAKNLSEKITVGKTFKTADLSVRYTIDIITNSVLGFNGKALEEPDKDEMRQMAQEMFNGTTYQSWKLNLIFLWPQLMKALNMKIFTPRSTQIMRTTVEKIANDRTQNNTRRNDFMDMILEQRKNGGWKMLNGEVFELEGDNLAAQLFMFFTAGYETSASAVAFSLFELARNQEIQDKVRNEINEVINSHGGLSYECLKDLKYMDMVINETVRKYPPFPFLDRRCAADYKLPGTDIVIPNGTLVMVPMMGFHHDERFWPEPETFDPERFRCLEDIKGKPYFPFGSGFRICLGKRFAMLQIKLAIIAAVRNQKLTTDVKRVELDSKRFTTLPKEDIPIYVTSLK